MKTNKATWLIVALAAIGLLAACASGPAPMGGDMGGMMQRHMAPIPAEYAGLSNPVVADANSLARGEAIYEANCAVCHGQEGWGDGAAAENLEPLPAPLAHTGQMLSDAYLYYRISEGGQFEPFNSAMPPFKHTLNETERWGVINYIRSLDGGMMGDGMREPTMTGRATDLWWIAGWVLVIGLPLLLALAVVWAFRRSGKRERAEGTPLMILKRRYAAGEIDAEQFEKMKAQIGEE